MISGFDIRYSIGGADADEAIWERMSVAFERAGDELEDLGKHTFPRLVPVFEKELAGQFAAEGHGPNTGSWAGLSKAYEQWKAANYPGAPILVRSGDLREALTSSGPHAMRRISDDEFDFGTEGLPYASFHQTGTPFMPSRPPFDFGDTMEDEIRAAAIEGAREALRVSGADKYLSEGSP